MAKKPLGKDQFGIQKVMRGGDYFADSAAGIAIFRIHGLYRSLPGFVWSIMFPIMISVNASIILVTINTVSRCMGRCTLPAALL